MTLKSLCKLPEQSSVFLSKDESLFIKGCAVIFMLFHHLFPFADRIPSSAEVIYLFGDNNFEVAFGWWGKYCVAIFLFVSGYGYSFGQDKPMNYYVNKVLSVYRTVILIFLIYIAIDVYFGVTRVVSDLNVKSFLLNMFGVHSNYNGEWWFLFPYVLLVLLTPLLHSWRKNIVVLITVSIIFHHIQAGDPVGSFLWWQVPYVLGFSCGVYSEKLAKFRPHIAIALLLSTGCYFIMDYGLKLFWIESMIFLVPLMIYLLKTLYRLMPLFLRVIFNEIGRKCLIIWLVHSFYCYHFASDFIYSPKYSILILLNLLLVSYLSAVAIDFIEKQLMKGYEKAKYYFVSSDNMR